MEGRVFKVVKMMQRRGLACGMSREFHINTGLK